MTDYPLDSDVAGGIVVSSYDHGYQASEIAQITKGIEQVSNVVQTNSATAEQSAAASEELSGQAEMLKQMVDAFKLKTTKKTTIGAITAQTETILAAPSPQPEIILDDLDFDKY